MVDNLGQCVSLQHLDVSDNSVCSLSDISHLTRLKVCCCCLVWLLIVAQHAIRYYGIFALAEYFQIHTELLLLLLLQPFMTLCPGLPGWVGTRRINHSGFCWSRHDWVAVASAEPYASYLHFAPEDNHTSTSSVRFLRAGCSSWHPTNSVKALKANNNNNIQ